MLTHNATLVNKNYQSLVISSFWQFLHRYFEGRYHFSHSTQGCLCLSWHPNHLSYCRKGPRINGHPLILKKKLDKQTKDEESDNMRRKSYLNGASNTPPPRATSHSTPPKEHMAQWAWARSLESAMSCALNMISVFKDLPFPGIIPNCQPATWGPNCRSSILSKSWRMVSKLLPLIVIWLVMIFTLYYI